MKKIVLIYGILAGLIVTAMMYYSMPAEGEKMNFEKGEVTGYITMIIALSLIFFAIKSYRDKNNGVITFGKAFLIGLYITLTAGVIYATGWEIYYRNSGANFMDQYLEYYTEQMQKDGMSKDEIDSQLETMNMWKDKYQNPVFRFILTLFEILPVGILISLIAAAILKRTAQKELVAE